MDLGLKGKKAWILGGSQGLGFAIAESLWLEGASVILSSRSESKLEQARRGLLKNQRTEPSAGSVEVIPVDMLLEDSIAAACLQVGASRNAVDILVINTGGPAAGLVMDLGLADWDSGYRSLLRSTVQITRALVPGMKAKGWGRLLTVTSTSAKELIPKLPVSGVFRAGLSAWVKYAAKELGRSGILVNNLLPGPVNTDRLSELAHSSPDFYLSMKERSALGRLGEPYEIGQIAAFLCSTKNSFITGTDILADGGSTVAY